MSLRTLNLKWTPNTGLYFLRGSIFLFTRNKFSGSDLCAIVRIRHLNFSRPEPVCRDLLFLAIRSICLNDDHTGQIRLRIRLLFVLSGSPRSLSICNYRNNKYDIYYLNTQLFPGISILQNTRPSLQLCCIVTNTSNLTRSVRFLRAIIPICL